MKLLKFKDVDDREWIISINAYVAACQNQAEDDDYWCLYFQPPTENILVDKKTFGRINHLLNDDK